VNRKAAAILVVVFAGVLALACGSGEEGSSPGVGPPRRDVGPESVFAYGIVEARKHSTLSAKFPGKLEEILVLEGEAVERDRLLARFESAELEAAVDVAQAEALVAQARLADALAGSRPQEVAAGEEEVREAEERLEKRRLDRDRARILRDGGLIPEADWEAARLDFARAEAAFNQASERLSLLREGSRKETVETLRRELGLARAKVALARAALDNARVTAPFDGVITRKHREEGEAMDIGYPVMDIATLDDRYVRAEIDETDVGRIREGQAAEVSADGFPGLAFQGRVIEVKRQMGPKMLIPTDPSKMVDFKVLDAEVSLPADCPFPIKLPVNVRIYVRPAP